VRLWAGPVIGLNFNVFLPDGDDIYAVGSGVGPVLGANFHLGQNFSLGATFGYMYYYSAYIASGDTADGGEDRIFVQLTALWN